MPKAGFLVARFKWLNYIPDWPARRILWQLKWREILQGECPIHTVLWLFNILNFDFPNNKYFLSLFFLNNINPILYDGMDETNEVICAIIILELSWIFFNIISTMKDMLCNFVVIQRYNTFWFDTLSWISHTLFSFAYRNCIDILSIKLKLAMI